MCFGKSFQSFLRSSILGIRRDLPLFASGDLLQLFPAAAESQFAVEPERSRVDGFVVVLADLIRINRNCRHSGERAKTAQGLCVNPCRFALTVSVKSVEAHLDPVAQANRFDVVNGNAVLERKSGDVSSQRQSPLRRQVPEIHDDAAPQNTTHHRSRIAERRAVEFAVAHRHHFTNGVHDLLTVTERHFDQMRRGFGKFVRKRYLAAHNQWLVVIIELSRTLPIPGARELQIPKMPAQRNA